MEREEVSSSHVVSVGYDPNEQVLEIQFRGGAVYQYLGVEESTYNALMESGSKGGFVRSVLSGYNYERIE